MMDRINLIAIFGSIFLLLIILELVRRRYLSERYSLVWILTGIAFLILSIKIDLLRSLSKFLGFSLPSNALFFFGILFLILIVLSLSVILSRLSEKNKILTQEIVLLKKRIEDIEKSHNPKSS